MRKIYLSNIDPEVALNLFLEEIKINLKTENIKVQESFLRISSEAVFAKQSSPNFNSSAMDGISVISKNTFDADYTTPKTLFEIKDFIYVDTGDLIKEPYDAVIMIEDIQQNEDGSVEINKPASPWQHVRPMGEDIVANEMIIPKNHKIRAVDIGALLASNITKIKTYKKPQIGILPTGTEIVEPSDEYSKEGEIVESNSRVFENLAISYGGKSKRYDIEKDDFDKILKKVEQIVEENDIIIINAGSSAGREDFTAQIIEKLGKVIVHGIATKPGKPTILGIINEKPIIGIPGYPVASYYVFDTFVKPLIFKLQGMPNEESEICEAFVSKRIISSLKHKEFVPVKLGTVKNRRTATPLNRGAGVTMSLVRADGFLLIDKNSEGYEVGEKAEVKLLKDYKSLDNTIVSIGSHDLIMDIIGSQMREELKYFLSSSHVGSMGGIMALKRDEAHIAPIHLLDEETGEYNISYINKFLSEKEIVLVKGVKRLQGFIVKKGNPKNILSFLDLTKDDIVFVNRQRGSGTRLLLDYKLKELNINTENIVGYERDFGTHMAVAASVLSGSSDVGLGVYSAAHALGLDFIPVGYEEYDFAMEKESLKDEKIIEFIKTLKSQKFKEKILSLGGYEMADVGTIINISSNCVNKFGFVKTINVATQKGEKAKQVQSANLIKDFGIENDIHSGDIEKQIILLNSNCRDDLNKDLKRGLCMQRFLENIEYENIDNEDLKIGTKLKINDCVLEIKKIGKSCYEKCQLYTSGNRCNLSKEVLYCNILNTSKIKIQDKIYFL